jgi:hypothetical protein
MESCIAGIPGAIYHRDVMENDTTVKAIVAIACAYEIAAITTGRVPTLSWVCRHHRAFEAVLIAVLILHFHVPQEKEKAWLTTHLSR